jgi:xylulokinase
MPWLNGERTPVEDRNLRGGFLNLSLATGRAELARAVLEGVALNARWMLDAVESFIRRPLPSLRILGGGAESDLWCQIHADVLGRPIERVAKPTQANLRGAALFAAISLGRLSLEEVPQLVPVDGTFQPNPAAVAVYGSAYREFKQLYGRLKGIYARLNRRSP